MKMTGEDHKKHKQTRTTQVHRNITLKTNKKIRENAKKRQERKRRERNGDSNGKNTLDNNVFLLTIVIKKKETGKNDGKKTERVEKTENKAQNCIRIPNASENIAQGQ